MWFKQIQLFQLLDVVPSFPSDFLLRLEGREYQPCLPSVPYSAGWVSPFDDEDAPLFLNKNGYQLICLQVEEKILPPIVINQEVAKIVKRKEVEEDRSIGHKEKYVIKEDITTKLLPRAFSKLTKVYAYIDVKNHRLVLGTANPKKTEQFMTVFKKSFGDDSMSAISTRKIAPIMIDWLKHQEHAGVFTIEKACVLQDVNHESRIIRCKGQDLFASCILSLIKDGCHAKQLSLNWQDHIDFVLGDDFALQGIQYQDGILKQAEEWETNTKQQRLEADFMIMTESLSGLIKDLLSLFVEPGELENASTKTAKRDNVIPMVS